MASALLINLRILKNDPLYFIAPHRAKAHYLNDKKSRNSWLSKANAIERHWQLTGHVTEGGS